MSGDIMKEFMVKMSEKVEVKPEVTEKLKKAISRRLMK